MISANLRGGHRDQRRHVDDVVVEGNLIGTDATGTADRGNGQDGIFLSAARRRANRRHGSRARNVISGNGFSGVEVGLGGRHER